MRMMTALLCLGLTVCIASGTAAAQNIIEEPRLRTHNSRLYTSGGGSVAYTRGLESLLINPAAFTGRGELALLSGSAALYAPPNQALRAPVATLTGQATPLLGSLSRVFDDRIDREGLGFGGSAGVGYAGSSLGLGIIGDFDMFLREHDGAYSGHFLAEAGLVGGLAISFDWDQLEISVGADIRPFVRLRSDLSDPDQVDDFLSGTPFFEAFAPAPTLNGFGLALNTGMTAAYRSFTFGLAVRDIGGTQIVYREHPLGEVVESAVSGVLPPGGNSAGELYDPEATYRLRSQSRIGVAWQPDWGDVFEPALYMDFTDLHRLGEAETGFVDVFSAGAELTFGRFLTVRGGTSAFGFGAGAGIRFGVVYLDGGISFGREVPPQAGLDMSIRF